MKLKKDSIRVALASLGPLGVAAAAGWEQCRDRVLAIRQGHLAHNSINNETLDRYIYHGNVRGLHSSFPRDQYLAVTYEGCLAICDDPIAIYEAHKALGLAANWIFPLAILLSLPWESHRRKRIARTFFTVLSWLGSPQSALTATIWNFRQLRDAHRAAPRDGGGFEHNAAYFVLCCLNQFGNLRLAEPTPPIPARPRDAEVGNEAGEDIPMQRIRLKDAATNPAPALPTPMLKVLIYGVFRPLSADMGPDVKLTRQLLLLLAFQLRMYRRRAVIPTLANLGVFLVAFIFSVVLAFAQLGDENTPFSLAFGLLMTWLPLQVIFSIVDRNPVSSERTAILISRWLYNVNAVKTWADTKEANRGHIQWWRPRQQVPEHFRINSFIGQGREAQYCGLPYTVLQVVDTNDINLQAATEEGDPLATTVLASLVAERLHGGKPFAWYVVAVRSLLLVWTSILSAFVVSYQSPTVGLGCRSFTYVVFGVFSSLPWLIQFYKRPPRWAVWISRAFSVVALVALLFAIIFQVTGLASNCFCKSSAFGLGKAGGYMDFEGYDFWRKNFGVDAWWIGAAVIGGAVPTVAFIMALFWWVECKPLWQANEDNPGHWVQPPPPADLQELAKWADEWADMSWLQ